MMNKGMAIWAGIGTLVILSGACRSQARATIQVSGEKSSGREFIYANHVLKLRDIALRGPWISGGVAFNFGIVGHTPAGEMG